MSTGTGSNGRASPPVESLRQICTISVSPVSVASASGSDIFSPESLHRSVHGCDRHDISQRRTSGSPCFFLGRPPHPLTLITSQPRPPPTTSILKCSLRKYIPCDRIEMTVVLMLHFIILAEYW